MAAVSQTVVHRDEQDSRLSAIHGFLQQAVSLYRVASSVHSHTDVSASEGVGLISGVPLKKLIDSVRESLHVLISSQKANEDERKDPQVPEILFNVCHKVGQDLSLRLDRLRDAAPPSDAINSAAFRELWPVQDVAAFGIRLEELAQRLQELEPSMDVHCFNARAFSSAERLAISESQGDTDGATSTDSGYATPIKEREQSSSSKNGTANSLHEKKMHVVTARPRHTPDSIIQDFILENLAYKSMRYREQEVTKAHSKTFEWVFINDPETATEHQISSWLRGDEHGPIYWITGKPGSGKSTFMGFLFDHQSTLKRLKEWAGGQKVCKAGFFFWTSGSKEQRSQTGLLRSLLHQLLLDNPEFMESTFPELWAKLRIMTTKERIQFQPDWSADELMAAFKAFVNAALLQNKLCLFIDGLDEFEGDHTAIIDFFKDISAGERGKSVKLCLSSRPWSVFENAFQHAVPNLRLQDLTYEDMYRYTRDRLRENVHIRRAFKSDASAAETVIKKTIERADGVFLWVRLALNEIIARFQPGTTLQSLIESLLALPTELYDLFDKLLFKDRDEAQLAETAALFQLMRARELVADFIRDDSANSLMVWELAFAIGNEYDGLALGGNVEQADNTMVLERCRKAADQVVQAFAGLLELHARQAQGNIRGPRFADESNGAEMALQLAEQRVTYIHRTVRDWLMEEPGVLSQLVEKSPPDLMPISDYCGPTSSV
ncbi:hypothetical protein PT974_01853 [Cladobotryum mycophilum]|uniref:NACHT domain-containing protein n=1 Tax=Cladobotryum mycophilum TaxID=491253 RepID=A0ABR0SWJ7_9HYPO